MRRISLILAISTLTACGATEGDRGAAPVTGETAATSSSVIAEFPVTVSAANGEVTVEQAPQRIVSLAPTATEVLFAIGAGAQVAAVDEFSTYPAGAPITDLSGFEPNVEAVAAYEPDLVVVSDDLNDVVSGLQTVGIPVVHLPSAIDLDDTYSQIEVLGAITGNLGDAAELVSSMQTEIEELAGSMSVPTEPLTYYHELDSSLFTVTSATFIGQIYQLAGLGNIADQAGGAETGYPQLSAEYIVQADPDLIFLADTKCCGESADTIAARPGWDQLTAVTAERVVELDDDIASRWGPRVVDLLETIVGAVEQVEAP